MRYISVAEAIPQSGLRLVLSAGAPGPWGEAAKAMFDIKGIQYVPVQQHVGTQDKALYAWTGQYAAPAAMLDDERPRTRWYEILALAERLAPDPPLMPALWEDRVTAFGLTHAICGENGLGWHYRQYYLEEQAKASTAPATSYNDSLATLRNRYVGSCDGRHTITQIEAILKMLSHQLSASHSRGNRYFLGDDVSVTDLYWVTFSNFFAPIDASLCPMAQSYRDMALWMGELLGAALDPCLIDHREMVLRTHFRLPMCF